MPFDAQGAPEDARWLGSGIPNMLLTGLAQTPGLDVVSSQRVEEILQQMRQAGSGASSPQVLEVARRAGAGAVATGAVFKSGQEVRIDLQLQDVESGRVLGARTARGSDVFPLVDELTREIQSTLRVAGAASTSVAEVSSFVDRGLPPVHGRPEGRRQPPRRRSARPARESRCHRSGLRVRVLRAGGRDALHRGHRRVGALS